MLAAVLLAFREGLEAALILGIVLGVLRRTQSMDRASSVWTGAALAALISVTVGAALYALGVAFEGTAEEIFEGTAMLLAAGVLTWMIFWMARQGRDLQNRLENDVRRAALQGGKWALFGLAFVAVLREGIELALFLTAAAFTASAGPIVIGGVVGLIAAAVAGWLLFATTRRLDIRTYFRVTSFLLLIFAAGLVAHGVHEFNEVGWIPAIKEHVWDVNPFLDEGSEIGQIFKALFGYNGNPSLTEVLSYVLYWVVVLAAMWYTRPKTSSSSALTKPV